MWLREPAWLREGSAEFTGTFGAASLGLLDFNTFKAFYISSAKQASGPLDACVTAPTTALSCEYSLGFVAVDYLFSRNGGWPAQIMFWKLLGDVLYWERAFQTAFGRNVETFYAEFEEFRKTL